MAKISQSTGETKNMFGIFNNRLIIMNNNCKLKWSGGQGGHVSHQTSHDMQVIY